MKAYKKLDIRIVFFTLAIILLSSCKENRDTDFLLQNEWKVKSISTGKETLKPPKKTFREEAYILKFTNNSCFSLATSVNYIDWNYHFFSEGYISTSFRGSTKVCCENDFDEQMIHVIDNVKTYYCKGNKLFFKTDKNEKITFEKQ